jgi:hypothetical protein
MGHVGIRECFSPVEIEAKPILNANGREAVCIVITKQKPAARHDSGPHFLWVKGHYEWQVER